MNIGLVLLFLGCLAKSCLALIDTEDGAMAFLEKYGYIKNSEMTNGMPSTEDIKQKVLQYFQRFYNIPMTGTLDNKTYEMMNLPRCGMRDIDSANADMARRKRYSLGGTKWGKTDLTWFINSRTPDLLDNDVDRIMASSLKVWSDASNLNFRKVASRNADIVIDFVRMAHGDDDPFDGEGNVLAHAFFPGTSEIAGNAHFDEDERFTDGEDRGTNLLQVAAHEFGHSLGLRHSQNRDALMAPYYRGYISDFQLHADDIAGIRALYGENVGQPEDTDDPANPVDECMNTISFATRTGDGSTYLGNATHVYRIRDSVITSDYPKPIGDEFPNIPPNLDAALYMPQTFKTYLFKGNLVWRLTNQDIDSGYPRAISFEFPGLPNDLSAAFQWSGNGRFYFVKGILYYRIDRDLRVETGYPRLLSVWGGLPTTIDAALQYANSQTYFFTSDVYYRFNDRRFRVYDNYPVNTAGIWLGCGQRQLGLAPSTADPSDAAVVFPSLISILLSLLFACLYAC